MPEITGGTVEFGRLTKTADFENVSAKVTLSFAIREGEIAEAVVTAVGDMAQRRALHMLAMKGATSPIPPKLAQPEQNDRTRLAQEVPVAPKAVPAIPAAEPTPAAIDDILAIDEPAIDDILAIDEPAIDDILAIDEPAIDDILAIDEPATPATISDKFLQDACGQARERLGTKWDKDAVRKLIAETAGDPAAINLSKLPQDKRPAFLAALKAL